MTRLKNSPPLSPEQWNLVAVVLVCGLMGWMLRLLQLLCVYLEAHFAVHRYATFHFKDLGASLLVLRHAPIWHFQQLVRTRLRASSSLMRRVRVPFDIAPASLRLTEIGEGEQQTRTGLAIQVKSDTKYFVQVFWGVEVDALETTCRMAANASDHFPWRERSQRLDSALGRAVRALPAKLSGIGRQDAPHRLDDENKDIEAVYMSRLFTGDDAFQGYSVMNRVLISVDVFSSVVIRNDDDGDGGYITPVPVDFLGRFDSTSSTAPASISIEVPRYAAVIAVGLACPSEGALTQNSEREDEVFVQCAVIEFLPTPDSDSRPTIVKKINFTASSAYSSQEIFEGGECVICLEEALAVILLPCRHFCVCRVCLEEIDRCPICRASFSTYASYETSATGVPTDRT